MTATRNLLFLLLALFGLPHFAFGQFGYRVNAGNISAYALDDAGKELKEAPGSPFAAGTNPAAIAVDSASRFVYVANAGSNDVSAYTIDRATGSLTPVDGSPFAAGAAPAGVAIDPAGSFAYVANSASGDISAYRIDAATGALTPLSGERFQAGAKPSGVAVDPTGRFLYATDSVSGGVWAYRIDRVVGALTAVAGSPFAAGNDTENVVVDSTGGFVYAAGADGIWGFGVDAESGGLSPVSGSPFAVDDGPVFLAFHPIGKLAYARAAGLRPGLAAVARKTSTPSGTALVTGFTPGTARNNFTASFGTQFTVGASPLFVTALGRIYIAGNTGMHVVKLVRFSDGTDVPGGSVTVSLPSGGTAGQFVYTPLANPITLDANASYYLLSQETNGGDQFYDAATVTTTAAVAVNYAVVYSPMFGLFQPVGRANFSFGPVNLLYSTTPIMPPTVSITVPAAGATISGNNATVTATATAAAGLTVASVQFQVDNANVGSPVTTAPYSVALDTTKLTNGPHTLTAVATDSANTTGASAPVNVTVNNTATTVAITAPAAAATVSGNLTVSASAIAGSGLTITSVQFKLDNANVGAPLTVSPYGVAIDTTKLANGPHTLAAVATDSANNTVTSAPVNVTVNNTATTVAITAPAAGATVSGGLAVSATATPGTGLTITGVQFKVDNVNVGTPVTASPYGIVLDTTTLSNGPHTLVVVATDSSNASVPSAPVSVTVNNGGPPSSGTALVTVFTPGTARNNFTGSLGTQFTVGNAPLFATALGRIYIMGNTGTHVVKLVRVSDGSDVPGGSATVTLPGAGTPGQFVYATLANPVTLAANTAYYLISMETGGGDQFYDAGQVTATSLVSVTNAETYTPGFGFQAIGRANFSFGPVNLLFGTTAVAPPTVSITVPGAAATISGNNAPVTATAMAAPGLTIASVQFQVDNANVGAPVTTAPYSIALDTTKLSNGPHMLTAVATDSANATGVSAPVSVTVNNTATAVAITAPAPGAAVSGNLTVSATATPANGLTIASVQFKLDNADVGALLTTTPYSIVVDTTKLSNGPHTLTAVATDSASNPATSAPVGITVNNTTTTVTITAPAPGATVSGNLTVSATATPGTGLTIVGVQFKLDNAGVGAPVTTAPYSIVLDTTTLSNGPHTLLAVAMDSSNASVASGPVNVTVNNSGPPPSGTALVTGFTPGTDRNNFTGGFGMKFTVGATPLNVTALGRIYIAGNTGTHVVKLVRVSDGTDVSGGSTTVSLPSGTPAGQFVYAALPAPVTLDANVAYYLISLETDGGDHFYDVGPVTATGAVAVNSAVVYWPGFAFFVPVGPPNNSSGPVNLLYTTGP